MSEIKTSEIVGALLKQGSWYLTHAGWRRTENPSMVSLKAIETISALQSELTTTREAAWRAGAEAMRAAIADEIRISTLPMGSVSAANFRIPPCPPPEGDGG